MDAETQRAEGETHKGVLDERERVVRDLGDELDPLRLRGVVDAALEDAAAVAVGRDLDAVRRDGVVDELVVLWWQVVEALLDDVVAVEVCQGGPSQRQALIINGEAASAPLMSVTTLRLRAKMRLWT